MSCRSCGTGGFRTGFADPNMMHTINQQNSLVRPAVVNNQQLPNSGNRTMVRRAVPSVRAPTVLAVSGAGPGIVAQSTDTIVDGDLYYISNQGFVAQFVLDGSCGSCPSGVTGCHCMVMGPCGSGGVPKSVGTRIEAVDGNNYIQMEVLVLQRTTGNTFQEMPTGTQLQVGQYFAISFVDLSTSIRYYWQVSNSSDNLFLIPSSGGTPFDGTSSAPYRVFVLVDIGTDMTGIYRGTENKSGVADGTVPYWIQSVGRYDDKGEYYLVEGQQSGTNCTITAHQKKNMANPTLASDDELLTNVSYPMLFLQGVPVPLQPGRSVALPTGMQWWQWMFIGVAVYAAIVVAIIVVLIIMKVV